MSDMTGCLFCGGRLEMVIDCDDGQTRMLPCICQSTKLVDAAEIKRLRAIVNGDAVNPEHPDWIWTTRHQLEHEHWESDERAKKAVRTAFLDAAKMADKRAEGHERNSKALDREGQLKLYERIMEATNFAYELRQAAEGVKDE